MGDRSRKNHHQQQRPQSSNTYSRGGRGGFERGGFDRGGARGGRGGSQDKHAYYGKYCIFIALWGQSNPSLAMYRYPNEKQHLILLI